MVGEWDVYEYLITLTGSVQTSVDLARDSDVTVRFNESPRSYSFAYHPQPQGLGLAAVLVEGSGNYTQNETRIILEGRSLAGPHRRSTYDYTLSSTHLRLHLTENYVHVSNGSTHSGTRTVTILARRK